MAYSANVPLTPYPLLRRFSQSVSQPVMQYSHLPHASWSHAIPTGSPLLQIRHARPDGRDHAGAFMARHELRPLV